MANQTQTPKRETAIATEILFAKDGDATSGAIGVLFRAPSLNGTASVLLTDLNPDIQAYAACHGVKQKCIDAAAISRDPDTGRSATVQQKWEALMRVVDRITSPEGGWNETREGGGNQGGLLLRALMRLQPKKTREELMAWLETKTDKEQAALRANPKVAPIIAELKAEQDRKNADTEFDSDAALEELEAA